MDWSSEGEAVAGRGVTVPPVSGSGTHPFGTYSALAAGLLRPRFATISETTVTR
jgi:hypothetical protein